MSKYTAVNVSFKPHVFLNLYKNTCVAFKDDVFFVSVKIFKDNYCAFLFK
jgi:hypothetical protein